MFISYLNTNIDFLIPHVFSVETFIKNTIENMSFHFKKVFINAKKQEDLSLTQDFYKL